MTANYSGTKLIRGQPRWAPRTSRTWFIRGFVEKVLPRTVSPVHLMLSGSIKPRPPPTSEAIKPRAGCINNLAGQSDACLHADYHIKRISGSTNGGPIRMQTISCNIYKDKQWLRLNRPGALYWALRINIDRSTPELSFELTHARRR